MVQRRTGGSEMFELAQLSNDDVQRRTGGSENWC